MHIVKHPMKAFLLRSYEAEPTFSNGFHHSHHLVFSLKCVFRKQSTNMFIWYP